MSPGCASLIRVRVTPYNARRIERECQEALCLAHAYRDPQDVDAMRGKIWQCQQAQDPNFDLSAGPTLGELLEMFER